MRLSYLGACIGTIQSQSVIPNGANEEAEGALSGVELQGFQTSADALRSLYTYHLYLTLEARRRCNNRKGTRVFRPEVPTNSSCAVLCVVCIRTEASGKQIWLLIHQNARWSGERYG